MGKQKVYLPKSNVVDKVPLVDTMEFGELYVNFASGQGKSFLATKKNDLSVAIFPEKEYIENSFVTKQELEDNEEVISSALNQLNDSLSGLSRSLAKVAKTGDYNDLFNRPNLSTVATTGSYNDLLNKPDFSTVATTGSYNDLLDKPDIESLPSISNQTDKYLYVKDGDIGWSELQIENVEEITYSELVFKRNSNGLVPGRFYRIIDYVTVVNNNVYNGVYTSSAQHSFDLVVLALSENIIDNHAKAVKHEGDTYFANCDLSKWSIWYDLDDKDKYQWIQQGSQDAEALVINGMYRKKKKVDEYGVVEWEKNVGSTTSYYSYSAWSETDVVEFSSNSQPFDVLMTDGGGVSMLMSSLREIKSINVNSVNGGLDVVVGVMSSYAGGEVSNQINQTKQYNLPFVKNVFGTKLWDASELIEVETTINGNAVLLSSNYVTIRNGVANELFLSDVGQILPMGNVIEGVLTSKVSTTGGHKGVIYRMIDEYGNDCPYDFKNVKFRFNSLSIPTEFGSKTWFRNNNYYYTFTTESTTSIDTTVSSNCHVRNNIIENSLGNTFQWALPCVLMSGVNVRNNHIKANADTVLLFNDAQTNVFGCNSKNLIMEHISNCVFGQSIGITNGFCQNLLNVKVGDNCEHIRLGVGSKCGSVVIGDNCSSIDCRALAGVVILDCNEFITQSGTDDIFQTIVKCSGTAANPLVLDSDKIPNDLIWKTVARGTDGVAKVYCEADLVMTTTENRLD